VKKIWTANGARHSAVAPPSSTARPAGTRADPGPARLRQTASGAGNLGKALATSQRQLRAARRRIESLLKNDSLLKQRFARLARKAAQVRQIAYHDELTGLANRSLLLDRFNQAVAQGARKHRQAVLLFIDLDEFKGVNDRLGHAAGDELLQQVAGRLAACVRASDTACRYGGDEFVVLLPEVDGPDSAVMVADRIRDHLVAPYVINGSTISVTASMGMAVYPVDGKDCGDLIRRSDIEMYLTKARRNAPAKRSDQVAVTLGSRRSDSLFTTP
jgi:diguanylate cyclase (GGDEF)-like protein